MPQISFQPSFWDPQDPQEKLMQQNPILGRLAAAVPWERQLWIRTPGLGDNISVGTPFLEIK